MKRGKPLRRTVELKATSWLRSKTSKPKRRKDTGPKKKVRDLVKERAQGKCELCGFSVPERGGHIHHIDPRGMGGTSRPEANLPSNLLYLHPSCHLWTESNREKALSRGLLVKDGSALDVTAVWMWHDGNYGKYLLKDDGSAEPQYEETT